MRSRRVCGVLGSPIAHSLSPALHLAAYRALGLDWDYEAHDVDVDRLAGFVRGLSAQWRGLSLTMPLKQAAVGLCDEVEPPGRLLRSVNTLVLDDSGSRIGHNTDVSGFVTALVAAGAGELTSAVVVGAGATARSALAALAELGSHRVVV
ncbi:MAG: shikimate dehydrogenase family protein, partial [Nocardioidaceae bacterium]